MSKSEHIDLIHEYNWLKKAYADAMRRDYIGAANGYMLEMQEIAAKLDALGEENVLLHSD